MSEIESKSEENTKSDVFVKWKCFKLKWMEIYPKISFNYLVRYMYGSRDPSSIGIVRFLYGLLMVSDVIEERGGSIADIRWGEPRTCHFPLFPTLLPLKLPYMGLIYGIMWMGSLGIMLGYKFRTSCIMFFIPYWYIFFLDKSYWNNHSYLYGVLAVLFTGTCANHWCSIDALLDKTKRNKPVPYWNYFLLKFQIFLLYFYAGMKKTDMEWLEGYAMTNLGQHWIFDPFKLILTSNQIDLLVIHWFGFILDLTVGFWLLHRKTRPYAILFCSCFHLMNSRLFSIGMFPYVGLATLPLFCEFDWPKQLGCKIKKVLGNMKVVVKGVMEIRSFRKETKKSEKGKGIEGELPPKIITLKHKLVVALVFSHCGLQMFLPYSHFITKGYNNWTNGLYGYSWDMMVHSWDTILVVVKVVDNRSDREHFLDPSAWVNSDRWTKHGDMAMQYAQCLKENLLYDFKQEKSLKLRGDNSQTSIMEYITSENISIYLDVWCSLNGRFQQRMFNPNYDLLQARWSPFKPVEWLLPLLTEYSGLRKRITTIQQEVYTWSNYSDALFIADFPGLNLENYITEELGNISLTVLEGTVLYENEFSSKSIRLEQGVSIKVPAGVFHKIYTVSEVPSCFMYTYVNKTKETLKEENTQVNPGKKGMHSPFPILENSHERMESFGQFLGILGNSFLNVFYNVPMVRRKKLITSN